jgi:hypothetical protein
MNSVTAGPTAAGIMAFFGAASLLLAVLSAGIIVWQVIVQYKMLRLPQASGTLVSCDPVLSSTPDMPTSGNTPRSASMWTVEARYHYNVDGVEFQGSTFAQRRVGKIVNRANSSDPAPESIARLCGPYRPGFGVKVYYHPDNPKCSFIYFNSPFNDWAWGIIPVIAGIVSGIFFMLADVAKKLG